MRDFNAPLFSNFIWNTVGSVYYQGCLWLLTVLVVRFSFDFQNSGYLALAMSIGNIMFALGSYNMRTYQVADVHNRFSLSNYIGLRVFTDIVALFICLIYSFFISRSFSSFAVCSAYVFFKFDEAFVNVIYGFEQKKQRLDLVGKSYVIRGSLYIAVFTFGMLALSSLFYSICLMALSGCLVTILFDIRHVKNQWRFVELVPYISKYDLIYLLKTCFPSVIALFVSTFVVSGARQYFALIYGEEALGIYASVATPCVVIQVLAQNLYQPIIGPIAIDYRTGLLEKSIKKVKLSLVVVAGVGIFLSLLLSLLSHPLLSALYGSGILPYADLFFPVLVVSTLAACLGLLTDLLIVFGHMKSTLLINLVALAVTMSLLRFACSAWYMNGINIALLFGYSAALLLGLFILLRSLCSSAGLDR